MSEQVFIARLSQIEDQADAMQERVDAYRDQHLARLFVESEYSQEKLAELLAKRWGKEVTQQWVSYRIRFGRFLAFFTTDRCEDSRLPADLTEWKFRKLWEATEAGGNFSGHRANTEAAKQDELRRFAEVYGELRAPRPKKAITKVSSPCHRERRSAVVFRAVAERRKWHEREALSDVWEPLAARIRYSVFPYIGKYRIPNPPEGSSSRRPLSLFLASSELCLLLSLLLQHRPRPAQAAKPS